MPLGQKLLIDMVAFTVPVLPNKRLDVLERLTNKKIAKRFNCSLHKRKAKGRYKNNYGFRVFNNTSVAISAFPIRKNQNFFRAEFNPAKLTREGTRLLRKLLIAILRNSTVKQIYFHAPITRIDIALDIFDMLPDLYIHLPRFEHSEIHRRDNTMLSQIIGSKGRCRITMYNKDAEQGIDDGERNYQRIEVRYRDIRCSMHQLSDKKISDYLLRVIRQLNFYRSDFLDDERFALSFRNCVYKHGLNAALFECDDNTRRRYRRYLETFRAHPITTDNLSIDRARAEAFKSLVHIQYRDQFLAQSEAE